MKCRVVYAMESRRRFREQTAGLAIEMPRAIE